MSSFHDTKRKILLHDAGQPRSSRRKSSSSSPDFPRNQRSPSPDPDSVTPPELSDSQSNSPISNVEDYNRRPDPVFSHQESSLEASGVGEDGVSAPLSEGIDKAADNEVELPSPVSNSTDSAQTMENEAQAGGSTFSSDKEKTLLDLPSSNKNSETTPTTTDSKPSFSGSSASGGNKEPLLTLLLNTNLTTASSTSTPTRALSAKPARKGPPVPPPLPKVKPVVKVNEPVDLEKIMGEHGQVGEVRVEQMVHWPLEEKTPPIGNKMKSRLNRSFPQDRPASALHQVRFTTAPTTPSEKKPTTSIGSTSAAQTPKVMFSVKKSQGGFNSSISKKSPVKPNPPILGIEDIFPTTKKEEPSSSKVTSEATASNEEPEIFKSKDPEESDSKISSSVSPRTTRPPNKLPDREEDDSNTEDDSDSSNADQLPFTVKTPKWVQQAKPRMANKAPLAIASSSGKITSKLQGPTSETCSSSKEMTNKEKNDDEKDFEKDSPTKKDSTKESTESIPPPVRPRRSLRKKTNDVDSPAGEVPETTNANRDDPAPRSMRSSPKVKAPAVRRKKMEMNDNEPVGKFLMQKFLEGQRIENKRKENELTKMAKKTLENAQEDKSEAAESENTNANNSHEAPENQLENPPVLENSTPTPDSQASPNSKTTTINIGKLTFRRSVNFNELFVRRCTNTGIFMFYSEQTTYDSLKTMELLEKASDPELMAMFNVLPGSIPVRPGSYFVFVKDLQEVLHNTTRDKNGRWDDDDRDHGLRGWVNRAIGNGFVARSLSQTHHLADWFQRNITYIVDDSGTLDGPISLQFIIKEKETAKARPKVESLGHDSSTSCSTSNPTRGPTPSSLDTPEETVASPFETKAPIIFKETETIPQNADTKTPRRSKRNQERQQEAVQAKKMKITEEEPLDEVEEQWREIPEDVPVFNNGAEDDHDVVEDGTVDEPMDGNLEMNMEEDEEALQEEATEELEDTPAEEPTEEKGRRSVRLYKDEFVGEEGGQGSDETAIEAETDKARDQVEEPSTGGDAPSSDVFLSPKKRIGRPPGSKNKPKKRRSPSSDNIALESPKTIAMTLRTRMAPSTSAAEETNGEGLKMAKIDIAKLKDNIAKNADYTVNPVDFLEDLDEVDLDVATQPKAIPEAPADASSWPRDDAGVPILSLGTDDPKQFSNLCKRNKAALVFQYGGCKGIYFKRTFTPKIHFLSEPKKLAKMKSILTDEHAIKTIPIGLPASAPGSYFYLLDKTVFDKESVKEDVFFPWKSARASWRSRKVAAGGTTVEYKERHCQHRNLRRKISYNCSEDGTETSNFLLEYVVKPLEMMEEMVEEGVEEAIEERNVEDAPFFDGGAALVEEPVRNEKPYEEWRNIYELDGPDSHLQLNHETSAERIKQLTADGFKAVHKFADRWNEAGRRLVQQNREGDKAVIEHFEWLRHFCRGENSLFERVPVPDSLPRPEIRVKDEPAE